MTAEPIQVVIIPYGSKYSEELIEKLLMAIELGASLRTACNVCCISENTLRDWRKSDKDLNEKVTEAIGKRSLYLIGRVRAGATEDWRAAAWMLEKTDPDFQEKPKSTMVHEGRIEVVVTYVERSIEGDYAKDQEGLIE